MFKEKEKKNKERTYVVNNAQKSINPYLFLVIFLKHEIHIFI